MAEILRQVGNKIAGGPQAVIELLQKQQDAQKHIAETLALVHDSSEKFKKTVHQSQIDEKFHWNNRQHALFLPLSPFFFVFQFHFVISRRLQPFFFLVRSFFFPHRFQKIFESTDERKKIEELASLSKDFNHTARTYGQIIIAERYLPIAKKTIKPMDIGGIAGGQKYIVQGKHVPHTHTQAML